MGFINYRYTQAFAGAALLSGCAALSVGCAVTDTPDTFTATITAVGQADRVDKDAGTCYFGDVPVSGGDLTTLSGSTVALVRSKLVLLSIERVSETTTECRYSATFEGVPSQQRDYSVLLVNSEPFGKSLPAQAFTTAQLRSGAVFQL